MSSKVCKLIYIINFTIDETTYFHNVWVPNKVFSSATAELLAVDRSARFLVFGGRGRGPTSEYLESICPCYHFEAGEPLGFIFSLPAKIPLHGQKQGQWWPPRFRLNI